MGRHDGVDVAGLGLCTPLGLSAPETRAEMAAGTQRFRETAVLDRGGEPVRASVLDLLPDDMPRQARMIRMAITALHDSLAERAGSIPPRLPLCLGLPGLDRGGSIEPASFPSALEDAVSGVELVVDLHDGGRASFWKALEAAIGKLRSGEATAVLAGAVDSLCDAATLASLAGEGRVLAESNPDGIIPGEGAGFALLSRDAASDRPCRVLGCAVTEDPRPMSGAEPNLAEGLTEAFRQLRSVAAVGDRRVDHVYSGQTGETFWGQEFSRAYLRNATLMPEPMVDTISASHLGDVGAAAGAIQFAVAALDAGRRPAARMLVYSSSDDGVVGACVIANESDHEEGK